MTHLSRRSPLLALVAVAAIIFSACGGAQSQAPSEEPSQAPSQAASEAPYDGQSYPDTAVDCANPPAGYTGEFSQIKAVDRLTVEFDLCRPDVAFLSKIAFSTNAILDSDWLTAHAADKSYVRATNGTGPYNLKEWVSGDHVTLEANPNYWGDAPIASTLIFRWGDTAEKRLQDLQAGQADGIDNVAPDDFATVQADSNLQLINRAPFTILYLGFNVDDPPWNNEAVRQAIAKGLDRQRITDTFNPPGDEVADFFTPCSVAGACEGDKWYDYDRAKAISELQTAGFDFSKTYDLYFRPKVRGYFPNPPGVAQDIQAQFKDMGINVTVHTEDNDTYIDNSNLGKYSLFLLGWGGDYPDMTDFLDYHFGTGAQKAFGTKFTDLTDVLSQAAAESDPAKRLELYATANNLVRQHVPMIPINHASSAVAYLADVTGAQAGPLTNDAFWVVKPGDRTQLVFEQNSETSGLYCGDESDGDSLRNCEQIYDPLYTYSIGGADVVPNIATECTASTDLMTWTCTLKDGVKFFDGAALDANDVVTTFAAMWDTKHPLHVGNGGTFEYWGGLWGGFLNPPAS